MSFKNSTPSRTGGHTVFFQRLLLGDSKDLQRRGIKQTRQCCLRFDWIKIGKLGALLSGYHYYNMILNLVAVWLSICRVTKYVANYFVWKSNLRTMPDKSKGFCARLGPCGKGMIFGRAFGIHNEKRRSQVFFEIISLQSPQNCTKISWRKEGNDNFHFLYL